MDPRVVALVCLTVIVVTAVAGLTVVAVLTERSLRDAATFTLAMALCVAALGGLSGFGGGRRHRWRVEREDVNETRR